MCAARTAAATPATRKIALASLRLMSFAIESVEPRGRFGSNTSDNERVITPHEMRETVISPCPNRIAPGH